MQRRFNFPMVLVQGRFHFGSHCVSGEGSSLKHVSGHTLPDWVCFNFFVLPGGRIVHRADSAVLNDSLILFLMDSCKAGCHYHGKMW